MHKPQAIAARVPFYEHDSERVPLFMSRAEVSVKLRFGLLAIRARDAAGVIIAVQSSGTPVSCRTTGARPGSFGIARERLNIGTVFTHHKAELPA